MVPGSQLHQLVGVTELAVNSTHHQAVASAGPQGWVTAVAPDGVPEAIESRAHRFALGVQWHPEYMAAEDPRQSAILRGLVEAAAGPGGARQAENQGPSRS